MSTLEIKCKQVLTEHLSKIFYVDYSPDGKTIASCSSDGNIIIWCVNAGVWECSHKFKTTLRRWVVFSRDGRFLACWGSDKLILILDVKNGLCIHTLNTV